MKKRLIGFLFGAMLISMCVGCGAKSTTSEQPETATEITIEESTTEQTEATSTPEENTKQAPEATVEPSEETTAGIEPETAVTEPTETTATEPTETPTSEPVPQDTYTDMSTTMYTQQTTANNPSSAGTYDLGDGVPRQYGVLYVNTCGLHLVMDFDEVDAIPSQGPFPYPLYTLIDNEDGSYIAYEVHNHMGFIDGNFINFSTERNDAFTESIYSQGYYIDSPDRYAWESCVGGYDEGCIHRIIVRKREN